MSLSIQASKLTQENRDKIKKELSIRIESGGYGSFKKTSYIYPYAMYNSNVILPFSYAIKSLKLGRPDRDTFPSANIPFQLNLRPEQDIVKKEAIRLLNKQGHVMISCFTGFGKTCLAIKLASKLNMKTLVMIPNKVILIPQWIASVKKFCGNTVKTQMITTTTQIDTDCDVFFVNGMNVVKMAPECFQHIGVVIIDEAHLMVSELLSQSLQYIHPRYVIGLTATPYRPDDYHKLLKIYFGDDVIFRKLHREHFAYKIETGFTPNVEIGATGKTDWNSVLESQASHMKRNELIIDLLRLFKDRVILVLCKRVNQGKSLVKKLMEQKEDVTSLIGTQKKYEQTSRILVATCQKAGVGFDHPRLDCILLAGDLEEYFIQYLGRCFRTQDSVPIILDLVDNNPILKRHWRTRQKVYVEHGGTVKDFRKEYPKYIFPEYS